jgi:hypothetical protein
MIGEFCPAQEAIDSRCKIPNYPVDIRLLRSLVVERDPRIEYRSTTTSLVQRDDEYRGYVKSFASHHITKPPALHQQQRSNIYMPKANIKH